MSATATNQVIFIPTPGAMRENVVVDRGPRRTLGQVVEWRTQGGDPIEIGNSSKIRLMFFGMLREQVSETAYLPPGWDSGSAGPLSDRAIQNAIRLLDTLESARILPTTVIPTCDDSILISYPLYDRTIEWEFFSTGDNVRVEIDPVGERSYMEVTAEEINRHI